MLELEAVADPQAGHGSPARAGAYRLRLALKCLLRGFGLRCVRVAPALPHTDPTPEDTRRGQPEHEQED